MPPRSRTRWSGGGPPPPPPSSRARPGPRRGWRRGGGAAAAPAIGRVLPGTAALLAVASVVAAWVTAALTRHARLFGCLLASGVLAVAPARGVVWGRDGPGGRAVGRM